ncbi:hypothetical protein CDCA_CDCA10G3035 [Cyanidium caldarium]|uniref:Mitochondrial import inner membrane translocase subunit TIM50 n=1 Tax=Cyanidium caldarium TaxID=2771 RepID=A0AAV9IY38_CYACA|nr:hypothetical protein CDCA_CDCA10G3035 [Cyanidium caldarium]
MTGVSVSHRAWTRGKAAAEVHALRLEVERLRRWVREPGARTPKLLVLDLNGLLVVRSPKRPRQPGSTACGKCFVKEPDAESERFYIWCRPHARSFMAYALERFHVGVWSTARRSNVEDVLRALLTESQRQSLAFVLDQSDCERVSGRLAPGHAHKPWMCKNLQRIWQPFGAEGMYHEHNTVLVDDDAYKCVHNPPNTAVMPQPWSHPDRQADDTFLADDGPLRRFLSGLAAHQGSVRDYLVRQNILAVVQRPPDVAEAIGSTTSSDPSDALSALLHHATLNEPVTTPPGSSPTTV